MSKYLYGMHDECDKGLFLNGGWVVLTRAIGHDPNDHGGEDFREWVNAGITPIVRLNNGYAPDGTIPMPEYYGDFAIRCGNFVKSSAGCTRWIIGNEPNHSQERPHGQPISATNYAACYVGCRQEIRQVAIDHEVIMAAIAPWNIETGDWINYFLEVLGNTVYYGGVDAIALHTYTHGHEPGLVTSDAKMDYPYNNRYYHFRAYQDFMLSIPKFHRDVPVYITETNQNDAWLDESNGWVQVAYKEIDDWNQSGQQPIHCLALYRYGRHDKWYLDGKKRVLSDFVDAQKYEYQVPVEPPGNGGNVKEILRDSFEQGFYTIESEVKIPNGWLYDYTDEGGYVRPEYNPEVDRVYDGDVSAAMRHRHTKLDAVLYRQIKVKPGAKIHAQAWLQIYNHEKGLCAGRILIDTLGGTDFHGFSDSDGEWWGTGQGDWGNEVWHLCEEEATADADTVTIFLHIRQDFAVNVTGCFWDLVVVTTSEEPDPPIPPVPGESHVVLSDGTSIAIQDGTLAEKHDWLLMFNQPNGTQLSVNKDSFKYAIVKPDA